MERKKVNIKLKDRIRNSSIWQITRVTDIVQYVTKTKWLWTGKEKKEKRKYRY